MVARVPDHLPKSSRPPTLLPAGLQLPGQGLGHAAKWGRPMGGLSAGGWGEVLPGGVGATISRPEEATILLDRHPVGQGGQGGGHPNTLLGIWTFFQPGGPNLVWDPKAWPGLDQENILSNMCHLARFWLKCAGSGHPTFCRGANPTLLVNLAAISMVSLATISQLSLATIR